ncbi:MAG: class I SAM-dependent RNA methyltransferase [Hyphomicrobiaceae bacterium]
MTRLTIERLGHEGDGVAETPGGRVFVPLALPGETVEAQVDGERGRLVEIVSKSRDRREPICPHFGACGGCVLQHLEQAPYLAFKRQIVADAFASRGLTPEIGEVVPIAPGTRRRVVLTARRGREGVYLGFHALRGEEIVAIKTCAIASPAIVRALPGLRALAAPLVSLRKEVRLTVTAAENGLDVAIDAARRDVDAAARAALVAAASAARVLRVTLGGEPVVTLGEPIIDVDGIKIPLPPGGFLQAAVESEAILQAQVAQALTKAKRVADLFSGLGTFSLPLARRAQVTAVEADKASLAALSIAHKRTPGLKPIRTLVRDLFREPLSPKELEAFDAVVVDPPRQGAKAQAEALAKSKVPLIVAVSCNPATLARDCRILVDAGFTLGPVTPVDQFLFSPHIEIVTVLRRA